jgi:hypothetical protein
LLTIFHFFFNEIEVNTWFFDQEYRRLVPKVTTELCSFYKNLQSKPMLKTLINDWQKAGRVPTKCPVKKVHHFIISNCLSLQTFFSFFLYSFQGSYNLLNYTPQSSIFPSILPSDKFRMDYQVFKSDATLFNTSVIVRFYQEPKWWLTLR